MDVLRHGLEKPGRFWTLADMRDRAHRLELAGRESRDGEPFRVLKLTLSDGFEIWYWVNESTCLIERSRDFRAFHPDLEPEKTWTETIHDRFERIDGIVRPMRSRTIDFETGDVLATTRVVAVTHSFGIGLALALWLSGDSYHNQVWPFGLLGVFLGIGLFLHYALTKEPK